MEDVFEFEAEHQPHGQHPKNWFDKIVIGFCSIVMFVSSLGLAAILSIVTFYRYVLEADLNAYDEVVTLIAFWLYFTGAAYGAYNNTHVSADVVNAYAPEGPIRNALVFLRDLITVAVAALFTWYGYDFFMFGYLGPLGIGVAIPKTAVHKIPFWTSYLPIFGGLIIMTIYFFRNLCLSTKALIKGASK